MSDTLARLTAVFADVFEDEGLAIDRGTTARDVEGWDSVMHVNLMLHVEQRFGIRFTAAEISDLPDVGALVDLIERKL